MGFGHSFLRVFIWHVRFLLPIVLGFTAFLTISLKLFMFYITYLPEHIDFPSAASFPNFWKNIKQQKKTSLVVTLLCNTESMWWRFYCVWLVSKASRVCFGDKYSPKATRVQWPGVQPIPRTNRTCFFSVLVKNMFHPLESVSLRENVFLSKSHHLKHCWELLGDEKTATCGER